MDELFFPRLDLPQGSYQLRIVRTLKVGLNAGPIGFVGELNNGQEFWPVTLLPNCVGSQMNMEIKPDGRIRSATR